MVARKLYGREEIRREPVVAYDSEKMGPDVMILGYW